MESQAIVVCLDRTDGVGWELDLLATQCLYRKCLFLVHSRFSALSANVELLRFACDRLKIELPLCFVKNGENSDPVVGFYFAADGTPTGGLVLDGHRYPPPGIRSLRPNAQVKPHQQAAR